MANAKLDVDIASFVSDINTAKGVLKGLNAEMKAADAEFKATGNSEQQLTAKTKTLNSQIRMQKSIVDNAKNALKAMDAEGVDPADASYQRLYATMMNANAGMNEAQAQLNALGSSAQEAATGADQLTSSVNKIGKKISLDQVISGIDKITTGLSNAAKKAVELGKELWNNVMDSAALSDDILTQATILDMTPEQYQQYKGVFDTIADITVKDWMNAKRKVEKAMNDPTNDQMDALKALGLGRFVDKYGVVRTQEIADNWEDGLWRIAGELQKRVSSGEISMEMADVYGEALFGKNFSALKPLFDLGKEGFIAALKDQAVISDDALKKNTALNEKVIELDASFKALQAEVVSGLAPALTSAATALDGVLKSVLEYLQKPEGKKMLEDLGTAVSGLFDDLGSIDPEQVVTGFTGVITSVTNGVQWLVDNVETVKGILGTIVSAWALSNVAIAGLEITKLIQGIMGLTGAGAAAAAGEAGTAVGKSWGAGFAAAVLEAAPWLTFLYTLFNPAGSAGDNIDTMYDENGNRTNAGREAGMPLTQQQDEEEEAARRENRKRIEEIQKRNERNLNFRRIEHDLLEEEKKSAEIDKGLTDLISQRNERKTTWNPLLSVGIGEDLLPEEAQYWLRGMYAPWSQFTDEDFNMTDILLPWKGVTKLLSQNLPSENQPITNFMDINVPVNPEVDANAAGEIAEHVGPVEIPVQLTVTSITTGGGFSGFANYFDNLSNLFGRGYANGLPNVTNDGLYRLHKGEQVVPARAVSSQNYNSNLYVESMYMNNGTDAAGLAAAMAAAQRRQMSGFGS